MTKSGYHMLIASGVMLAIIFSTRALGLWTELYEPIRFLYGVGMLVSFIVLARQGSFSPGFNGLIEWAATAFFAFGWYVFWPILYGIHLFQEWRRRSTSPAQPS